MRIKEAIVVEGRDDTAAVSRALDADTIETHGFGIAESTWELLDKAYAERGLIIFTDPDHAGEEIRARLTERYPKAGHAFLQEMTLRRAVTLALRTRSPALSWKR